MIVVSVVVYKTDSNELAKLLSCLSNSVDRIFIVDNSPTDSLRCAVTKNINIEYVYGHGNVGYGAAHNIAIRKSIEAKARYHVVINPDIYFGNNVIEEIRDFMDTNSDIGQLMPKVYYPNGELQYLCKLIPTPFDLIFKRFTPSIFSEKRLRKFQLRFTNYDQIMNIPYLSGCFMFFRVSALNDVGLFDERFFMYPEDIDITRRMHEKYKTIFYPYVSIIHAHAAESKTNPQMLKIHIVNMVKYFNKWGWAFDSKRRKINKKLLAELEYNE